MPGVMEEEGWMCSKRRAMGEEGGAKEGVWGAGAASGREEWVRSPRKGAWSLSWAGPGSPRCRGARNYHVGWWSLFAPLHWLFTMRYCPFRPFTQSVAPLA